jgi:hypothetical protein
MRKIIVVLIFLSFAWPAFCADTTYKQVLIFSTTNAVRIRLPLTDVTGKVRVKAWSPDGFGQPVAPSKVPLDKNFYLEWQTGYDTPTTNSPTVVPAIRFQRNGEMKYGHELSKMLFDAVQLGFISTNDLARELRGLKKMATLDLEKAQSVQVETNAVSTNGFQRAVQRVPQFTCTTPDGSVQIQLKPKQRAVGFQPMIYVCLPLDHVLTMDGSPRPPGKAKSKETVYYDFTRANTEFLWDIVHAFGMASEQHNADMQQILEKILVATKP